MMPGVVVIVIVRIARPIEGIVSINIDAVIDVGGPVDDHRPIGKTDVRATDDIRACRNDHRPSDHRRTHNRLHDPYRLDTNRRMIDGMGSRTRCDKGGSVNGSRAGRRMRRGMSSLRESARIARYRHDQAKDHGRDYGLHGDGLLSLGRVVAYQPGAQATGFIGQTRRLRSGLVWRVMDVYLAFLRL